MMGFTFASFVLALLSTATAAPFLIIPGPHNYLARTKTYAVDGKISKRDVGGAQVCSGTNFTGSCWHGTYPLMECIDLNDYAGHVLSFKPDEGTECYLMQGRCDDNEQYADLYSNSTEVSDLSGLEWIAETQSYICFTPLDLSDS